MQKTIKIGYTEQSKSVVADAKVEYTGDTAELPSNDEMIAEAQEVFDKAQRYATKKTMEKR